MIQNRVSACCCSALLLPRLPRRLPPVRSGSSVLNRISLASNLLSQVVVPGAVREAGQV